MQGGCLVSRKTLIVKGEVSVTRGVCIPVRLLREAEEEARRRGVSVNSVIVDALRLYLKTRPLLSDKKVLEALRALASESGAPPELKRLAEALSGEKGVVGGG
jgi:hypothetical protein